MKQVIKNRKGMNMVGLIEDPGNAKLAFLVHGFGSFKEHPLLESTGKILRENGFTTVRFDLTNSIGESDGKMEDGTVSGYLNDFSDIINWAKLQAWYREPFLLVGHSLGGYCAFSYAAVNVNKVNGLIIFSPYISGKLFQETEEINPILEDWRKNGIREWTSSSSPGVLKRSKYEFIEDGLNHDIFKFVDSIRMPVLLISGENDKTVPCDYQKVLAEKLNNKSFYVIKDGDHNLKGKENSQELRNIINNWVKKYGNNS